MLSAGSTARPPLSELYVIVNSKLGPEFNMPSRSIRGVLGRSIAVALTAALRAELMLVHAGAQRHGIELRIAHVDAAFNHPARGPFDGKYMQALYEFGVAAGKNGTAFEDGLPGLAADPAQRRSSERRSPRKHCPSGPAVDFGVGEPNRQPPRHRRTSRNRAR